MREKLRSVFTVVFFLVSALSSAQEKDLSPPSKKEITSGWSIGINASVFGPGIFGAKTFGKHLGARIGINYLAFNLNHDLDVGFKIRGEGDYEIPSLFVAGDFYFTKNFHFVGGLIFNRTDGMLKGSAKEDLKVNDIVIKAEKIGSVTVELSPSPIIPFLGLGYGRTVSARRTFSFNVDLGAMYIGKPNAEIKAVGLVSPTSNQENETILEDVARNFQFLPFLQFQFAFKL